MRARAFMSVCCYFQFDTGTPTSTGLSRETVQKVQKVQKVQIVQQRVGLQASARAAGERRCVASLRQIAGEVGWRHAVGSQGLVRQGVVA